MNKDKKNIYFTQEKWKTSKNKKGETIYTLRLCFHNAKMIHSALRVGVLKEVNDGK